MYVSLQNKSFSEFKIIYLAIKRPTKQTGERKHILFGVNVSPLKAKINDLNVFCFLFWL